MVEARPRGFPEGCGARRRGSRQVVPKRMDGRRDRGLEDDGTGWCPAPERADTGERFVLFAEQTSRARSRREVLESLTEHAAAVAGGYRSVIWAQDRDETCFAARRDLAEPALVWISSSLPRLASPVLVTRADAESSEGFAGLAGLYETTGSIAGSLASLDEGLVLVVLERRSDRVWEPRHWFLLRATAGLARASLERLEALEEIEERGRK